MFEHLPFPKAMPLIDGDFPHRTPARIFWLGGNELYINSTLVFFFSLFPCRLPCKSVTSCSSTLNRPYKTTAVHVHQSAPKLPNIHSCRHIMVTHWVLQNHRSPCSTKTPTHHRCCHIMVTHRALQPPQSTPVSSKTPTHPPMLPYYGNSSGPTQPPQSTPVSFKTHIHQKMLHPAKPRKILYEEEEEAEPEVQEINDSDYITQMMATVHHRHPMRRRILKRQVALLKF